jgi:hypothetical protein
LKFYYLQRFVYKTNGLITKNKFKIMNIGILILCILIMAGIITLGNNQVKITNNQSKIAETLDEINKKVHR